MSNDLYWALCVPAFAVGLLVGRSRLGIAIVLALWLAAGAIAAVLGAFEPTGEDSAAGLVFFFVFDSLVWVVCALLGLLVRAVVRRHRQRAMTS